MLRPELNLKRKRIRGSPQQLRTPLEHPWCRPSSAASTASVSSDSTVESAGAACVAMAVPATLPASAVSLTLSMNPRAASASASTSHSSTSPDPPSAATWSFLAHPVLAMLPKWPGPSKLADPFSSAPPRPAPPAAPAKSKPPPSPLRDAGGNLPLLSLLDIPPIAASLASHLYGHDLLNLRLLNTAFAALLAAGPWHPTQRPYYHVLLLKTLLCPRDDLATEPTNTACAPAGGNAGPCVFCATVVCPTCVSPEIWTTRRYRYLCPRCTVAASPDTCTCQRKLWICRPCYKTRWLPDLVSSTGSWLRRTSPPSAVCVLCSATHNHASDKRLPAHMFSNKRMEFRAWMNAGRDSGVRAVGCAWCKRRVDGGCEDFGLRPETIRRGEEKGRRWIGEMERRRREREDE